MRYSKACAFLALFIGSIGFSGWVLDIDALTRIHPSLVSMKFNTSVCLIVAAISLMLFHYQTASAWMGRLAQAGGIFIASVGLITLAQYSFGMDFGIDQLFFQETANRAGHSLRGRMGVASTLIFILLGMALLTLPKKSRFSSICALLSGIITLLIFLIYFFRIERLEGSPLPPYLTIALHTVVATIALASGILLVRPEQGILKSITNETVGAKVARRMLPGAIFLPIILGWLETLGRTANFVGPGLASAVFVLLMIFILIGLILGTVAAVNREETERKQTEQALRMSEQQLRFVSDHVPILIVHCDAKTCYKFANAPYAERFGFKPEEIIGKRICDVVGEVAYQTLQVHVESALRGNRVDFDVVTPHEKLGERWMHCTYVPELAADGAVHGFLAVIQDVTHRKEAENALQHSEERFRALVTAASDVLYRMSPDWKEMRRLRGTNFITDMEQPSRTWLEDYIYPEDRTKVRSAIEHAIATRNIFELEHRIRRDDGEPGWTFSRAIPLMDEKGSIIEWFGATSDITERKRAEEKIQRHSLELEERVRDRTADLKETNEQLEAFVYSIAHDLRAPLRAMQGFSQLLVDDHGPSLDESARNYLNRISASSSFMDKMIMDLLAFGRAARSEIQLNSIPVDRTWKAAIFQCSNQIQNSNAQIETVDPLPSVLANEATLTQILANLLSNAVKFVAPGTPPVIRFHSEILGDYVRLWVEDKGVGIPPEYHERAFRVFERLQGGRYPGTGIGLSIVRKGVERMGGRVGLESEPGKGSRFWIELKKG